jgi:four helix bundle protein
MDIEKVYNLSMDFSQNIWNLVGPWPYFARDTVGKQLVRSADSVSANIREGLGRYSYKDRNLFNVYSRGSLFETKCWLEKALARELISKEDFDLLIKSYDVLHIEINKMIKNTRSQTSG